MKTFLKISLIVLAVLLFVSLCGGWGAMPFVLIGGVVGVIALGISGVFTVVSTVVGLALGLVGMIVGLVCLLIFAPVALPLLLLALPLLLVVGVIGGLVSLCAG